jgi:hypothetical protein
MECLIDPGLRCAARRAACVEMGPADLHSRRQLAPLDLRTFTHQEDGQPQDASKYAAAARLHIEGDLGGAQLLDQVAGVLGRIADLIAGTVRRRDARAGVARVQHHIPELALLQFGEKVRERRLGGSSVPSRLVSTAPATQMPTSATSTRTRTGFSGGSSPPQPAPGTPRLMRWPSPRRRPRAPGGPRRGSRGARRSCRTAGGASPAQPVARHEGARTQPVAAQASRQVPRRWRPRPPARPRRGRSLALASPRISRRRDDAGGRARPGSRTGRAERRRRRPARRAAQPPRWRSGPPLRRSQTRQPQRRPERHPVPVASASGLAGPNWTCPPVAGSGV